MHARAQILHLDIDIDTERYALTDTDADAHVDTDTDTHVWYTPVASGADEKLSSACINSDNCTGAFATFLMRRMISKNHTFCFEMLALLLGDK